MSIQLFEHNRVAYEAVLSMLKTTGKAAVIHPTGTGKSFIGFRLCEAYPEAMICWLSPSEHIFRTQLENLKQAADGYEPENIQFYTYARLMNMSRADMAEMHPDYIVLDEFHRCGAQMWGQGARMLLDIFPDVPVLGLSATAIRYLDNQRNMADELFDGHIASEMTLGDAIVRGILNPPTYIVSMYAWQQDLEKYEARIQKLDDEVKRAKAERYLTALKRALDRADGIDAIFRKYMKDTSGKYIVFCADYRHMQAMLHRVPEWFSDIDKEPHIYEIYSDNPDTNEAFALFKADNSQHLKLLFCIDMLNEGIHIDDISGVILLRPTISPIIYKQQIGRALSASKAKEPIIFDIVNNFENLSSIAVVQEEMQVAVNYYRKKDNATAIVNEQFSIQSEMTDCMKLFHQLRETLTVSWDRMYTVAEEYYRSHGHLSPTNNYKTADGYSLGAWLATQRSVRKGNLAGNLSEKQIHMLDAIGMRWENSRDFTWNRNYAALIRYKAIHGNIDVPGDYVTEDNIHLGRWVVMLRTSQSAAVRRNMLTPERKQQLDALGMIWNKVNYLWEKNYQAALDYYMKYQHLNVPKDYRTADGIALGVWLSNICAAYRKSSGQSLTAQQKERLEAIGLPLSVQTKADLDWQANYEKAKQYYIEHGSLEVPYDYTTKDGFRLGYWVRRHKKGRKAKSDIRVTEERRRLLNEIGMIWDTDEVTESSWQQYYRLAEKYYKEHGNLKLAARAKYDGMRLGNWIARQRAAYRAGKLTEEQHQKLHSIGMVWEPAKLPK